MIFFGLFFSCIISCKKFIEVIPPKTELIGTTVFSSDASAKAAIDGIYSNMMSSFGFASGSLQSLTALTGLASDELINFYPDPTIIEFYQNALDKANSYNQAYLWSEPYKYIYSANAIIEGLSNNPDITTSTIQQLTGEAKFIRSFCNFYLVSLFGDIPLNLTTDYRITSTAKRSPQSQVYQQIISDLKDAQTLLLNDYSFSKGERVRPNKWVATALLARVLLYTEDWPNAEIEATAVINNTADYSLESDLNKVFLANSMEAIWQLMPNQPGFNTNEGRYFILTGSPTNVTLSNQVINAFEPGDTRKANWIGSFIDGTGTYYFPYKYKVQSGSGLTEYSMVLRLAEQYLIRAEARAWQNDISGAQDDLNAIRTRAGLSNTSANTRETLLDAIISERQVELFTEWGHRWLDLKRTNNADAILGPIKSPDWQSTDTLFPIPLQEIQNNVHIVQNEGY
ncbi:MAG: RagB/SusD family nutrient uptake outer membrane protein [Bacteroidota bacterium]